MPVQALLRALIVRHNPLQSVGHIGLYVVVPVLVERERARGVLDEEVEEADLDGGDERGDLGFDVWGYEVAAAGLGGEGESFLGPGGHGGCLCGGGG